MQAPRYWKGFALHVDDTDPGRTCFGLVPLRMIDAAEATVSTPPGGDSYKKDVQVLVWAGGAVWLVTHEVVHSADYPRTMYQAQGYRDEIMERIMEL